MKSLLTNVDQIFAEAKSQVEKINDIHELETIKSLYLGKKGKLTDILKGLAGVDPKDRPKIGQVVNQTKDTLIDLIAAKTKKIKLALIEEKLNQEAIDVTMPSLGQSLGSSHPITRVRRILEEFFVSMGFVVVEGPEVETDFYNFTALNIPPHHPARTDHDTFYFDNGTLLRTQTSPVQIRAMQEMELPLRIICPGKVFRRDNDATHSPMFHQLEMLMVDENLTLANLKWIVSKFIKYFFGENVEYRFRPSYFPFTEPSAEVDVKWKVNNSERWLELGGCGVVHPNVLKASGVDHNRYSGLAFGFGIDRLAMSYYGIDNIRMLFENDLEFLRQF